uniref:Pseudouridine synthase RsuA/RluA-like domain-containing protein n=1 Tax=Globisporangium ultimum (strain ATCC 200006 / CBS 805.95 / DAOM BR144) TaxID=431595 RepID=K3WIT2_GLOUD
MAPWETHGARWLRHVIARRDHEMRLDRWLRQQFPRVPQCVLQAQLRKRKIRVQAASESATYPPSSEPPTTPGKANAILREGWAVAIDAHVFQYTLKPLQQEGRHDDNGAAGREKERSGRGSVTDSAFARELVQRVVYKDANFLVLDKPHGLAVQQGTALEHSLVGYLPALADALSESKRGASNTGPEVELPRLVHRLDKETSGLLVLARHRLAAAKFSALLQSGQVALWEGEITFPVDGKAATTLVQPLQSSSNSKNCSELQQHPRGVWLQLSPVTGRKHQLRVHCAQVLKAPIVGDVKYRGPRADRLYLHAQRIEFPDPFGPETRGKKQQWRATKIDVQRSMEHRYDFQN